MRRQRVPSIRLASAALALVALGAAAASCNQILGLDDFKNCPQDPGCPKPESTCTDAEKNGQETDVDCGGSSCPRCADGKACDVGADCAGGTCSDGTCHTATCTDGEKNGDETDIDCGGPACGKCADDKGCSNGSDCASKVCMGGTCLAPSCGDMVQNGDETDVDCGGPMCGKCDVGKGCAADGDCKGGSCGADEKCAATCTDGVKDGDETDVDCGGAACPRCALTKGCATGPDCESGVCQGGACVDYFVWAKSFGDQNQQSPSGLAVDTAGSVVFAGGTQGTVDFGGGGLASAGGSDVFVAKLDKDGNHKWSKVFGDVKDQRAFSLATDTAQNVIMLGTYDGTINFGGQTFTTTTGAPPLQTVHTGMFVVKLDTTGQHLWSNGYLNSLSGSSTFRLTSQSLAVGIDGSADICIAGGFQNVVNLGGAALSSGGSDDVFVACYDKAGNHYWSSAFGDASSQFATSIACDSPYGCSAFVVGGLFTGSIDFGGGPLTQASADGDVFVAHLGNDGAHLWSRSFATNDHYDVSAGTGVSVAADSMGNVYLTGHQTVMTDFGGGPVSGNFYLVKLDPQGNHVWSKGLAVDDLTAGGTRVNIAVDSNDDVLISNKFYGTADFGGGTLSAAGSPPTATYLAKFDSSGNHVWSRAFGNGGAGYSVPTGLATRGANDTFLAGAFSGQLDVGGPTPLVSVDADIFVTKLHLP